MLHDNNEGYIILTDYWELDATDVTTFYQICIHELSVLGTSRYEYVSFVSSAR